MGTRTVVDLAFFNEVSVSIINDPTRYGMNQEDYCVILEGNLREHQTSQRRQKASESGNFICSVRCTLCKNGSQTYEIKSVASDAKYGEIGIRCENIYQVCLMQNMGKKASDAGICINCVRRRNRYQLHQKQE